MPKNTAQRRIDSRRQNRATTISGVTLSAPAGVTDHGLLLGLGDDDHTQYLLADGTRTLAGNLAVASGITIDGIDLSAHAADPAAHHAPATAGNSGIEVVGQAIGLAAAAAGAGLAYAAGVLSVNVAGLGMSVAADAVTLSSSSNPGAAASILATDASGYLTLVRLTTTDRLRSPLIDTASGNLTVQPASDLILSPGSNLIKLATGKSLQSDGYASQAIGMRISYAGEGDFRYLFTDELHAKSFIADLEQALAGGQIISKSVSVLAVDFVLPAAGGAGTLTVRDLPSAPNMAVFQSGDYVGMRQFSRSAGSLSIEWAWGTVTGYADQSDGTQTWTFTRHSSTPGAASGTIAADSLALDFGVTGNGFYEVNAIDGVYAQNSPYWRIATWDTHPATQTVRVQGGNLRGLFGAANEYGFYAGDGTGTSNAYLRLSNQIGLLQNIPIEMYVSGTRHLSINPTYGIDILLAETEQSGITWRSTLGVGSPLVGLSVFSSSSIGASLYANVNDVNTEASVSIAAVNQAYTPNSVSLTLRRGGFYSSLAQLNANVIQFNQSGGSGTPTITAGGNTMWHAGNDGSGSTLDADTVDTYHAASFALLSGATFTGPVIISRANEGWQQTDGSVDLRSYITGGVGLVGTISNHPLGFYTNSSGSRIEIQTDGTVRFGNTSDLYGAKIQTNGNIHAQGAVTSELYLQVATASTPGAATGFARMWFDGTNIKVILPGGTTRTLNWT